MITCTSCSRRLSIDDDVCPYCGTPQYEPELCMNCGAELENHYDEICDNCKHELEPISPKCPNCHAHDYDYEECNVCGYIEEFPF